MKIFVAGSTGVLGQRIVVLLVSQGHEVTALTRREDRAGLLDLAAGQPRQTTVRGVAALEQATREAAEWVVLRYGMLYGPGTWYEPRGSKAADARAGRLAIEDDVTSFIHVDDAAQAAVQALDWPSGLVNICDDEPAPGREWMPAFCRAVGAPGPAGTGVTARQPWARGADNRHARTELGWSPRYPSWRQGFQAMSG